MNVLAISLVVVFGQFSSAILAQTQQETPRARFEKMLERDDANGDGQVSTAEFSGPQRLFERLDRNQDGQLSQQDLSARAPNQNRAGVPEDVQVQRDVVYGQGGGRDLTMHILTPKDLPKSPLPVFVWIHGGGWKAGSKDGGLRQCLPMVRQGFIGATIEYRLTGEAAFPAQIEDCKCAIRYLREHADKYHMDPNRIAVGGSSAGGHLAALVGTSGGIKELEGSGGWASQSSAVQAVVDLYGPTDFELFVKTPGYERHNASGSPESALLGGGEVLAKPDAIRRVNPITYIDRDDPPFLIIHGSQDKTVPANQSQTLHAALQDANVPSTLHVIDGAGHGGPQFGTQEIQQMKLDFLQRVILDALSKRRPASK